MTDDFDSIGWDGLMRADMDADLREVEEEYNGKLERRLCDHCNRDLLSHEDYEFDNVHGHVCEDCYGYIRGDY